jgi:hypothetical protein
MRFAERHLTTAGPIEVAGRKIKLYYVSLAAGPIDAQIVEAAEAFLPRLLPAPDDETPPASFVILHRGADAVYLNAYSWVWGNVVECRTAAAGIPFLGCPDQDLTHFAELSRPWIGCVWELGPFEHERSAWVRHVLEPDAPDLAGYLADVLGDPLVGRPRPD